MSVSGSGRGCNTLTGRLRRARDRVLRFGHRSLCRRFRAALRGRGARALRIDSIQLDDERSRALWRRLPVVPAHHGDTAQWPRERRPGRRPVKLRRRRDRVRSGSPGRHARAADRNTRSGAHVRRLDRRMPWRRDCHRERERAKACSAIFLPIVPAAPRTLLLLEQPRGRLHRAGSDRGGTAPGTAVGRCRCPVRTGSSYASSATTLRTDRNGRSTSRRRPVRFCRAASGTRPRGVLRPRRMPDSTSLATVAAAISPSASSPSASSSSEPAIPWSSWRSTSTTTANRNPARPWPDSIRFNSLVDISTMAASRTSVRFAAVTNGAAFTPPPSPQTVRLIENGPGVVSWTAASQQPWFTVSPASGTGSATLTSCSRVCERAAAVGTGHRDRPHRPQRRERQPHHLEPVVDAVRSRFDGVTRRHR